MEETPWLKLAIEFISLAEKAPEFKKLKPGVRGEAKRKWVIRKVTETVLGDSASPSTRAQYQALAALIDTVIPQIIELSRDKSLLRLLTTLKGHWLCGWLCCWGCKKRKAQ